MRRLSADETIFVGIDYQTKLVPAMYGSGRLIDTSVKLIKGGRVLGVPVLMTQQYTKGLGPTVDEITAALTEEIDGGYVPEASFTPYEKTSFSAMGSPEFRNAVDGYAREGRKRVVLFGIECHVCVLQTALDMLDSGFEVFIVRDATTSRAPRDKFAGMTRMKDCGVKTISYEDVLFEILGDAKNAGFRQISNIVK